MIQSNSRQWFPRMPEMRGGSGCSSGWELGLGGRPSMWAVCRTELKLPFCSPIIALEAAWGTSWLLTESFCARLGPWFCSFHRSSAWEPWGKNTLLGYVYFWDTAHLRVPLGIPAFLNIWNQSVTQWVDENSPPCTYMSTEGDCERQVPWSLQCNPCTSQCYN